MQIKRIRCDLFRATTKISNADYHQNCNAHFAAGRKAATSAFIYSAASQVFQSVIIFTYQLL